MTQHRFPNALREPPGQGSRQVRRVLHLARLLVRSEVHRRDRHADDHQRGRLRHAAHRGALQGLHQEGSRGRVRADGSDHGGLRRAAARASTSSPTRRSPPVARPRTSRSKWALHVRAELQRSRRPPLGGRLDGSCRARSGVSPPSPRRPERRQPWSGFGREGPAACPVSVGRRDRNSSGSPKSGNSRLRVQEERELDDLAVLDLEHLERPGLVAVTALARLVLPERGSPVRRDRGDHPRVATAAAGADPPAQDVVATGEPEVERRHRLRRVLVDQRRERVHVVALERRDVAGEQARRRPRRPRAARPSSRCWRPESPVRAAARCSPRPHSSRGAPQPPTPSSAAPRRESARHAASAGGAAGLRRTRAESSRARPPPRPDLRPARRGRRESARSTSPRASVFRFSATGSRAGPRSIGSARRLRLSSMSRQTFVAMR